MTVSRSAPLLSILIPTKDRYETLIPVLCEIARSIRDPRLELVVCDNSRERQLGVMEAVAAADPRISLHYFAEDLSIVENTERGIALCRGDYICFIGDDDLVAPSIMSIVEWLRDQAVDCLIYPPARYWWSNVDFARKTLAQRPGVFWLPRARGGAIKRLESGHQIDAVLARGGVSYMQLPRLYHGIASRRAVEGVRARFGRFVAGSSPDMAFSMSLALTTERYLSIDYPVTVFGASRNSGGGRTAARRHYGRIEDQAHLPAGLLDRWDPRLPRIWSEQTIYPQTIHEVMTQAGRAESGLSYIDLYGSLIAYEPHILPQLWPVLARELGQKPAAILPLAAKVLKKLAGRTRVALRQFTGVGMGYDFLQFEDVASVMRFMVTLPLPEVLAQSNALGSEKTHPKH